MSDRLVAWARLLETEGVRHHVDEEDEVIRVVFVTREYKNRRGERLAIVMIEAPDDGRRVRATIRHAFPPGPDAARACFAACCLAAMTPVVGAEYDPDEEELRLVAEVPVEDGSLTAIQLTTLIDSLVAAAERWEATMRALHRSRSVQPRRGNAA